MTRNHMTADGPVPFSAQEEAERDAEEASWAAQKAKDAHNAGIDTQIALLGVPFTEDQMAFLESILPGGAGKAEVANKRAAIAALKAQRQ